ncbi:SAM-dependent methyltransferase [Paraburkholderia bannensis]|uniref:SAM-dependent methyltransferase n=1 Tax=Paraburkholderia bannensis TaxID=765414 RepID=UPI0004837F79|nr:SAM-dependent methyltransferase [Paraburkholderia bannensis]
MKATEALAGGGDAGYFDEKFAADEDPWHYENSWYEKRKRALLLASLPDRHYRNVFEPGCANGALSAELAMRCSRLLCSDFSPRAVALARARLANFPHVQVQVSAVPEAWPTEQYDAVVISEIGYYLDAGRCAELAHLACSSLEPGGALLCCHWRRISDDFRTAGAAVHGIFTQTAKEKALREVTLIRDDEFLLQVWRRQA